MEKAASEQATPGDSAYACRDLLCGGVAVFMSRGAVWFWFEGVSMVLPPVDKI